MFRLGWVSVVVSGLAVTLLATSCGDTASNPRGSGESEGRADSTSGGAHNETGGVEASAGASDMPGAGALAERGRRDGQPLLGQKCRKDVDCGGDGLRCLSANEDYMDGHGAPGGGICTAGCTTDASCRSFDSTAVCATLGEAPLIREYAKRPVQRLCMLGCSLGAPTGNAKCHARTDLACRPFAPESAHPCINNEPCPEDTFCFRGVCRETACGPRCNSDADCGGQRRCNPFSGLCDEHAPTPVPLGAQCLGELDTTSVCGGGNCLDVFAELDSETGPHLTRVKEMCTQSCTLGTVCGNGAGACISPRLKEYALGDAGYCLQKCECDADCRNPADHCLPWNDDQLVARYGSSGVCDYAPNGTPSLTCSAGAGGAGGAGGATGSGGAGGND